MMSLLAFFAAPAGRCQHPPHRGFTLVELLVTLVVAGLLVAVAVPSFNRLMVSSRLTSFANELVSRLTLARSEAVKRGYAVQFNTNGAITAQPPQPANAPPITITQALTPPSGISSTPAIDSLIATPLGLLHEPTATTGYAGLVADISSNAITGDNHRCIYLFTGTTVMSCTDSQACRANTPNGTCQ
jgi:type IV fimbrial biogenesis protein FimT